jgi:sphingomyelin phosphodiesterase 2
MDAEGKFRLSLASLNTPGIPFFSPSPKERYKVLAQEFERLAVDIINLQEVHTYSLLKVLKDRLLSYPYVIYEPAFVGPKGGLVTFSKHPLQKLQFTLFTFATQPTNWRVLRPLGFYKGTLVTKMMDVPLMIFNTHLTANGAGDWSRGSKLYPTHEAQLDQLSKLIRQVKGKESTSVISGDFNIPKCSELYRKFMDLSVTKDVFGQDDTPTFHSEFLPAGKQTHRIDYIFTYSPETKVEVNETSLLFQDKVKLLNGKTSYLSDHIGLMAVLSFGLT